MPSESPTSTISTPAASTSRPKSTSYAVVATIGSPLSFFACRSRIVTGLPVDAGGGVMCALIASSSGNDVPATGPARVAFRDFALTGVDAGVNLRRSDRFGRCVNAKQLGEFALPEGAIGETWVWHQQFR